MTRRGWQTAIAVATIMCAGAAAGAQDGTAPKPVPLKNPVRATAASIKAGQQVFAVLCQDCHGPTGKGNGVLAPKNPPPADLTDAAWDYGSTDGEIFSVILNGVPKEKTLMKGLKGKLEDTEIWNVVNYLRSLDAKRAKN